MTLIGRCNLVEGGAPGIFKKVEVDLGAEVVVPMSLEVDMDEGTLDLEVVVPMSLGVYVDEETLDLEEETLDDKGWEEEEGLDEEDFELADFEAAVDVFL